MDLTHRFTVPAPLEEAWRVFNDLDGLAPCFPGATVSSVTGDEFAGSVKVKLGPIALLYTGTGHYVERDEAEHRVVIEARGKDKRGNGTATATVSASFIENGALTGVEVLTDLAITGKPAQFGRGVISDVSDKLLGQFVGCVSERFAASAGEVEQQVASAVSATGEAGAAGEAGESGEAGAASTAGAASEVGAATDEAEGPAKVEPTAEPDRQPPPSQQAATPRAPGPAGTTRSDATQEDLNLLGTVGPVLAKRYGPILALAGVLLFVLIKIIRRRS